MIEILQILVLALSLKILIKFVGDKYFELNDKVFAIGCYGGLLSVTMGNIFGGLVWLTIGLISVVAITTSYFVLMVKESRY